LPPTIAPTLTPPGRKNVNRPVFVAAAEIKRCGKPGYRREFEPASVFVEPRRAEFQRLAGLHFHTGCGNLHTRSARAGGHRRRRRRSRWCERDGVDSSQC
jgi:hypothetical protein